MTIEAKNRIEVFDNGLALIAEEAPWSEAISFAIRTPAGSIYNPPGKAGLASLTCEMTTRGAGGLGNREFLETLENLGVESSESTSQSYMSIGAVGLAEHWERSLELLTAQLRDPIFPEDELESCRQIQLQEIAAIEDEPARKTLIELGRIFYPDPFGRPSFGDVESVNALTIDDVRDFHRRFFRPNGTVVAVSGRFDWERIRDKVAALFGDWKPVETPEIVPVASTTSTVHRETDSAQTHIGLAFETIPFGDPEYHRAWGGVEILSGGMSSRLFSEVREKRGLCYSVFASYNTHQNYGGVFCYCGTTAERAQESLDVIVGEIDRLRVDPPTESEMERMKIRAKSGLVMQRESTTARAGAIVRDWTYLGKIRSFDETMASIDALTSESIAEYYEARGELKFRLATSGQAPLKLDEARLF